MPSSKVMHEFAKGALHSGSKDGPVVHNRDQAIAIKMSEQRKEQHAHHQAGAAKHAENPSHHQDGASEHVDNPKHHQHGAVHQGSSEGY